MKTIIAVLITVAILSYQPKILVADDSPIKTVNSYIQDIFGSKADIAKAVLTHESGLELNAINYNCRYNGRSTFCKKGDESKAWSVDCGIGQINVKGKECPEELMTLEGNMTAVAKVYNEQGLTAWVSFNNKQYKKFL